MPLSRSSNQKLPSGQNVCCVWGCGCNLPSMMCAPQIFVRTTRIHSVYGRARTCPRMHMHIVPFRVCMYACVYIHRRTGTSAPIHHLCIFVRCVWACTYLSAHICCIHACAHTRAVSLSRVVSDVYCCHAYSSDTTQAWNTESMHGTHMNGDVTQMSHMCNGDATHPTHMCD